MSRLSPLLPLVLLALFFLPTLSAANLFDATGYCFTQPLSFVTDFSSPLTISVFGLVFLIAIAYLLSQVIEKPELSVWAKSEGVTLAWSVILIGLVLSAFFLSCEVSNLLIQSGSAAASPLAVASAHLDTLSNNFGLPLASTLVQSSISNQLGSMYYAYWSVPVLNGGGMAYRANKRAWAQQDDLLADLYLPMMISVRVQKLLLDVLSLGVISILLPAALFLRVFFFSRDTGNLLIALSFAVFFALPLVYVFSFQATDAILPQLGGTPANPFAGLASAQDSIVGDAFQRIGFLATAAILFPNLALVVMVTMTMALNKALKGFVP